MIPLALRRRLFFAVDRLGGQTAAARKLGIAPETIRWWLLGRSAPRRETAEKLADLTGSVAEAYQR
jgi:DNA-binding transcriptional regulator YdaS (Cro superfamily)